jgi:hypothetical protein
MVRTCKAHLACSKLSNMIEDLLGIHQCATCEEFVPWKTLMDGFECPLCHGPLITRESNPILTSEDLEQLGADPDSFLRKKPEF